jgi:ferredoxin--NADP+ reductase
VGEHSIGDGSMMAAVVGAGPSGFCASNQLLRTGFEVDLYDEYAAGWIKRGPSGVIGTNKKDATETIELLLEDARAAKLTRPAPTATLESLLDERGAHYVEYDGWQAIDVAEKGAGEPLGRPRVKLHKWEKLLETGLKKITR